MLLKCLCHNLSVLAHAIHELGIEPRSGPRFGNWSGVDVRSNDLLQGRVEPSVTVAFGSRSSLTCRFITSLAGNALPPGPTNISVGPIHLSFVCIPLAVASAGPWHASSSVNTCA